VDLIKTATTSILESLPRATVGPPPAAAVPTIRWTPAAVSQIISPGETKTASVSFTASEDVSNVVIRVVPELQPFVQVNPSAFSSIAHGQTNNISITISASLSSPLGTFPGTVQLRSGSDPTKTLARPLPITVEVWQRLTNADAGISLPLPDFGQPARL